MRRPCATVSAPADDVEDEVEAIGLGVAAVRRAEAACSLELALVQVERVDLGGTRDACALNHREPDRAAADHADAGALPRRRRS